MNRPTKLQQIIDTIKGYSLVVWTGMRVSFFALTTKPQRATSPSPHIKSRGINKTSQQSPPIETKPTADPEVTRISKHIREKVPDFAERFVAAKERIILDRITDLASKLYNQTECIKQIQFEYSGIDDKEAARLAAKSHMYWGPELDAQMIKLANLTADEAMHKFAL